MAKTMSERFEEIASTPRWLSEEVYLAALKKCVDNIQESLYCEPLDWVGMPTLHFKPSDRLWLEERLEHIVYICGQAIEKSLVKSGRKPFAENFEGAREVSERVGNRTTHLLEGSEKGSSLVEDISRISALVGRYDCRRVGFSDFSYFVNIAAYTLCTLENHFGDVEHSSTPKLEAV